MDEINLIYKKGKNNYFCICHLKFTLLHLTCEHTCHLEIFLACFPSLIGHLKTNLQVEFFRITALSEDSILAPISLSKKCNGGTKGAPKVG